MKGEWFQLTYGGRSIRHISLSFSRFGQVFHPAVREGGEGWGEGRETQRNKKMIKT